MIAASHLERAKIHVHEARVVEESPMYRLQQAIWAIDELILHCEETP